MAPPAGHLHWFGAGGPGALMCRGSAQDAHYDCRRGGGRHRAEKKTPKVCGGRRPLDRLFSSNNQSGYL